jgi:hypothetical protein
MEVVLAKMKKFEFPVSKELRQSSQNHICGISIEGDDFVIEYLDVKDKPKKIKSHITGDKRIDIESVADLVQSKLSFFFDDAATAYCTGKLTDILDRLYDTDAAYAIDKAKKYQKTVEAKYEQNGNGNGRAANDKPTHAVKKYSGVSTTSPNGKGLSEAILINGKPLYATTINGGTSVTFFESLETADMKLRPPTKQEYPPDSAYEYASEDEFMETIRYALERDSLYDLYRDTKKFYTKERFVDTDPRNSTLLSLYTITSYFQDKFSTVPYVWLVGDNGSGKNSILMTYASLGYRAFYMTGASGANICEYLGTTEDGQGTIAEDELGDLDNDEYKRRLYMTGYAFGGCVPKILDASSAKSREQYFYRSYCQKMAASENLPSMKYSKGVLDREFVIKCVKGFPKYNIKATKKKTKTPEIMMLIDELQSLRKRLFAYRLTHYDDVIQEIEGINISGRALELTESALQLFYQFRRAEQDNEIFDNEIAPTLSSFLNDRLGRRSNSLEGKLYPIIRMMLEVQGNDEFDNDTIYNTVYSEMEGRELPGKTDIFYVDDLGATVTRTKILKALREKFKAVPTYKPLSDGSRKRGHKISKEVLERVRASYEDQWEIKIPPPNHDKKDTSAQAAQAARVFDQVGGVKNNDIEAQEPENHEGVERESEPKEPINDNKISPGLSSEPVLPVLPEQSYSIEDIIISLLKDGQQQDYFTLNDWKFKLMMLPVQHSLHSNEDEAEQTLQQLLQEGKVKKLEGEPGKYVLGEEREHEEG